MADYFVEECRIKQWDRDLQCWFYDDGEMVFPFDGLKIPAPAYLIIRDAEIRRGLCPN